MTRVLRNLTAVLPRASRVQRYFLPYVKPHTAALVGGLLLGALAALSEILRPWPLQIVFDHVLVPGRSAHGPFDQALQGVSAPMLVGGAALAIVLLSALGGLAVYGQTLLLSGVGQRVVARIRRDLFRHLMRLPFLYHARQRHGDLLMRLTGDIVLVRELLVGSLLDACAALLLLVGTLGMMLWLDLRLTLISLAITPVVAILGTILGERIRRVVWKTREKEGGLAARAGESLSMITVLQAFGATDRACDRFERDNRSGLRSGLKASRLEAVLTRSLDLITSVGLGVTLAVGAWSVRSGALSPGQLLVFLAYQRNLYRPIRQLARLAARTAKSSACGERIVEILETTPDVTDPADARPCPSLRGEIRFEGVTVQYPRGDVALTGIDLSIPAGSTVIIRGESGAGKTTLISLLPRLLDPTEGRVRMDGIDVREVQLDSLRRQVAMVFQDSVLLGVSVRDNILLGNPDAAPEEVEEAAHRAGVLRFTRGLPEGLDTVISERGATLSGGQRQRVALARAALRGSPILALDEPFAYLDGANRAHVIQALREVARGRTVIMATHDEDGGLEADIEVVLAGGRLNRCRELYRPPRPTIHIPQGNGPMRDGKAPAPGAL